MGTIYIGYDPKNRKLTAECRFMDNHIIKTLPSRKFDPKRKIWQVPVCRRNIEHMDKLLLGGVALDIDQPAQAMIDKHRAKIAAIPKPTDFPTAYTFKTTPMEQQLRALNVCHDRAGYALYMDMGTGKTKVIVDKFTCHYLHGEADALMVFCPVSVLGTWVEEIEKHCPLDLKWKNGQSPHVAICDLASEGAYKRADKFIGTRLDGPKFLIVGTESLSMGDAKGRAYALAERFGLAHRHMQVVDECHTIKGAESIRSLNIVKLGLLAKIKVVMTGTPLLQGLLDVFMYFEYLDPSIIGLGDYQAFKNRYAILSDDGYNRVVAYDNVEELLGLITPYIFQCTKEEAMPYLPPKMYQRREVQLSAKQLEVYKAIKNDKEWMQGDIEVQIENALQKYSALQTIVGGFINYDDMGAVSYDKDGKPKFKRKTEVLVDWKHNPKIKEMLEVIEENGGTARSTIIWAVHTMEIQAAAAALRDKYGDDSVVEFYGATSRDDRELARHAFNNKKAPFFVASQKAGGVGLTLIAATMAIYLSNSFRLVDRLQSEDRNHRKGQLEKCLYVDIMAKNTVDRDIAAALAEKKDLADWVRDRIASGQRLALALS